MKIVLLKFSENRGRARELMDGHKAWVKRGFEEGVFLLAGSLEPDRGGAIVAHKIAERELERMVNEDPFVKEKVVEAEILTIDPARTDERLKFLAGE